MNAATADVLRLDTNCHEILLDGKDVAFGGGKKTRDCYASSFSKVILLSIDMRNPGIMQGKSVYLAAILASAPGCYFLSKRLALDGVQVQLLFVGGKTENCSSRLDFNNMCHSSNTI